MASPAIIEPIIQKNSGDCAITCLAMLLGLPYVEVSSMAVSLWPQAPQTGLWTTEIRKLAKKLGHPLSSVPIKQMVEQDTGIIVVKQPTQDHVVLLFQGVIFNPADGLLYEYDTYFANQHAKAIRLLRA